MKVNDCCLVFIVYVQRTKTAAPFHQVECLKNRATSLHFMFLSVFMFWREGGGQVWTLTAFSPLEECYWDWFHSIKQFTSPLLTGSRQIPGGCWNHLARVLQRHCRRQGFGPLVEKSHLQGDLQTGQWRPRRIQDILLFVGQRGSSQQPGTCIIWSFLVVNCSEHRCWTISHFVAVKLHPPVYS